MIRSAPDRNGVDLRNGRRHRNNGVPTMTERQPPHSTECEQGVLGCCLLDPQTCINECIQQLRADGKEAFFDLRHQTIYETLLELNEERKGVDLITVSDHLKQRRLLEQVGGIDYLNALQDAVPSAANLSYYLDTVREKYMLRTAVQLCAKVTNQIYDADGDTNNLLDEFERKVLAIRQFKSSNDSRSIKEIVNEALATFETMCQRKGQITGLSTGFPDIDYHSDGLHGGEFIIMAAFPSVGKTSLCLNIVENIVLEQRLPVGVFSAEMSAASLVMRSLASRGRVSFRDIRDGNFDNDAVYRVQQAALALGESNLHIDDSSDMSIQMVRAKARRMYQQHGVRLIVADYAQMFSSPGAENHTMELDHVSKGFKNMAKELNIPVILLSQLTEDSKGELKLKGARALGEDADGLWFLKRKERKDAQPDDPTETVELILAKQRNATRNAKVTLTFFKAWTRFESAAKIDPQ